MKSEFNIHDCMSLAEAAKYLRISRLRLQSLSDQGLIRYYGYDTGKRNMRFFHKSELDRFVDCMKKECLGE